MIPSNHGRLAAYLVPALAIATLTTMVAFSTVPINLWVVRGDVALVLVVVYCVTLVAAVFRRADPRLHQVGAVLATVIFLGRAGGFLELVLDLGRYDLVAAVAERILLTTCLFSWHRLMVWDATMRSQLRAELQHLPLEGVRR